MTQFETDFETAIFWINLSMESIDQNSEWSKWSRFIWFKRELKLSSENKIVLLGTEK